MGSVPVEDRRFCGGFSDGLRYGFGFGYSAPVAAPSAAAAMALDGVGGEPAMAPSTTTSSSGKKAASGGGASDTKTAMALKSHSEAERRRRERINAHLATLRGMIPCTEKLEKAALLAEVINNVKELQENAVEVTKGCNLPSDVDEVRVEVEGGITNSKRFAVKASLCCEDKLELLEDLKQALQGLQLKTIRAEISTFGGRTKNVLVLMPEGSSSDVEKHLCLNSVHQALRSMLDKVNSQIDFLPRTTFSSKRRRISYFESSSSSS